MDDTLIKFILTILFVAIIIIILYFGMTDKILTIGSSSKDASNTKEAAKSRTNRLYVYIFSIILPLIGLILYLKEELLQFGIASSWYIAIFLGIVLAGFVITILYNYLPPGSTSLLFVNFLIFFIIVFMLFVGLAILYNMGYDYFSKQTGKTAFYIQLIFYIPCLISDSIKYLFNDLKTTPNMIFALFIAEILLVLVYIYGPNISNIILTENSIILLPDNRALNTFNTIGRAPLFQVNPLSAITPPSIDENDSLCVNIFNISLDDPSLADKDRDKSDARKPTLHGVPDPKHVSTGIDDKQNDTCMFNPYMVIDPYTAIKCGKITTDDLKNPIIYNSFELYDKITNQIKQEYNTKLQLSKQTIYNVNYAISFWTYLNYKPEIIRNTHETNILNYSNPANDYNGTGGNPKITFLNDDYNIYFTNHPKCETSYKYESNCLYKIRLQNQKWNCNHNNYSRKKRSVAGMVSFRIG